MYPICNFQQANNTYIIDAALKFSLNPRFQRDHGTYFIKPQRD